MERGGRGRGKSLAKTMKTSRLEVRAMARTEAKKSKLKLQKIREREDIEKAKERDIERYTPSRKEIALSEEEAIARTSNKESLRAVILAFSQCYCQAEINNISIRSQSSSLFGPSPANLKIQWPLIYNCINYEIPLNEADFQEINSDSRLDNNIPSGSWIASGEYHRKKPIMTKVEIQPPLFSEISPDEYQAQVNRYMLEVKKAAPKYKNMFIKLLQLYSESLLQYPEEYRSVRSEILIEIDAFRSIRPLPSSTQMMVQNIIHTDRRFSPKEINDLISDNYFPPYLLGLIEKYNNLLNNIPHERREFEKTIYELAYELIGRSSEEIEHREERARMRQMEIELFGEASDDEEEQEMYEDIEDVISSSLDELVLEYDGAKEGATKIAQKFDEKMADMDAQLSKMTQQQKQRLYASMRKGEVNKTADMKKLLNSHVLAFSEALREEIAREKDIDPSMVLEKEIRDLRLKRTNLPYLALLFSYILNPGTDIYELYKKYPEVTVTFRKMFASLSIESRMKFAIFIAHPYIHGQTSYNENEWVVYNLEKTIPERLISFCSHYNEAGWDEKPMYQDVPSIQSITAEKISSISINELEIMIKGMNSAELLIWREHITEAFHKFFEREHPEFITPEKYYISHVPYYLENGTFQPEELVRALEESNLDELVRLNPEKPLHKILRDICKKVLIDKYSLAIEPLTVYYSLAIPDSNLTIIEGKLCKQIDGESEKKEYVPVSRGDFLLPFQDNNRQTIALYLQLYLSHMLEDIDIKQFFAADESLKNLFQSLVEVRGENITFLNYVFMQMEEIFNAQMPLFDEEFVNFVKNTIKECVQRKVQGKNLGETELTSLKDSSSEFEIALQEHRTKTQRVSTVNAIQEECSRLGIPLDLIISERPSEERRRLKQLYEAGEISEEEYISSKEKIVDVVHEAKKKLKHLRSEGKMSDEEYEDTKNRIDNTVQAVKLLTNTLKTAPSARTIQNEETLAAKQRGEDLKDENVKAEIKRRVNNRLQNVKARDIITLLSEKREVVANRRKAYAALQRMPEALREAVGNYLKRIADVSVINLEKRTGNNTEQLLNYFQFVKELILINNDLESHPENKQLLTEVIKAFADKLGNRAQGANFFEGIHSILASPDKEKTADELMKFLQRFLTLRTNLLYNPLVQRTKNRKRTRLNRVYSQAKNSSVLQVLKKQIPPQVNLHEREMIMIHKLRPWLTLPQGELISNWSTFIADPKGRKREELPSELMKYYCYTPSPIMLEFQSQIPSEFIKLQKSGQPMKFYFYPVTFTFWLDHARKYHPKGECLAKKMENDLSGNSGSLQFYEILVKLPEIIQSRGLGSPIVYTGDTSGLKFLSFIPGYYETECTWFTDHYLKQNKIITQVESMSIYSTHGGKDVRKIIREKIQKALSSYWSDKEISPSYSESNTTTRLESLAKRNSTILEDQLFQALNKKYSELNIKTYLQEALTFVLSIDPTSPLVKENPFFLQLVGEAAQAFYPYIFAYFPTIESRFFFTSLASPIYAAKVNFYIKQKVESMAEEIIFDTFKVSAMARLGKELSKEVPKWSEDDDYINNLVNQMRSEGLNDEKVLNALKDRCENSQDIQNIHEAVFVSHNNKIYCSSSSSFKNLATDFPSLGKISGSTFKNVCINRDQIAENDPESLVYIEQDGNFLCIPKLVLAQMASRGETKYGNIDLPEDLVSGYKYYSAFAEIELTNRQRFIEDIINKIFGTKCSSKLCQDLLRIYTSERDIISTDLEEIFKLFPVKGNYFKNTIVLQVNEYLNTFVLEKITEKADAFIQIRKDSFIANTKARIEEFQKYPHSATYSDYVLSPILEAIVTYLHSKDSGLNLSPQRVSSQAKTIILSLIRKNILGLSSEKSLNALKRSHTCDKCGKVLEEVDTPLRTITAKPDINQPRVVHHEIVNYCSNECFDAVKQSEVKKKEIEQLSENALIRLVTERWLSYNDMLYWARPPSKRSEGVVTEELDMDVLSRIMGLPIQDIESIIANSNIYALNIPVTIKSVSGDRLLGPDELWNIIRTHPLFIPSGAELEKPEKTKALYDLANKYNINDKSSDLRNIWKALRSKPEFERSLLYALKEPYNVEKSRAPEWYESKYSSYGIWEPRAGQSPFKYFFNEAKKSVEVAQISVLPSVDKLRQTISSSIADIIQDIEAKIIDDALSPGPEVLKKLKINESELEEKSSYIISFYRSNYSIASILALENLSKFAEMRKKIMDAVQQEYPKQLQNIRKGLPTRISKFKELLRAWFEDQRRSLMNPLMTQVKRSGKYQELTRRIKQETEELEKIKHIPGKSKEVKNRQERIEDLKYELEEISKIPVAVWIQALPEKLKMKELEEKTQGLNEPTGWQLGAKLIGEWENGYIVEITDSDYMDHRIRLLFSQVKSKDEILDNEPIDQSWNVCLWIKDLEPSMIRDENKELDSTGKPTGYQCGFKAIPSGEFLQCTDVETGRKIMWSTSKEFKRIDPIGETRVDRNKPVNYAEHIIGKNNNEGMQLFCSKTSLSELKKWTREWLTTATRRFRQIAGESRLIGSMAELTFETDFYPSFLDYFNCKELKRSEAQIAAYFVLSERVNSLIDELLSQVIDEHQNEYSNFPSIFNLAISQQSSLIRGEGAIPTMAEVSADFWKREGVIVSNPEYLKEEYWPSQRISRQQILKRIKELRQILRQKQQNKEDISTFPDTRAQRPQKMTAMAQDFREEDIPSILDDVEQRGAERIEMAISSSAGEELIDDAASLEGLETIYEEEFVPSEEEEVDEFKDEDMEESVDKENEMEERNEPEFEESDTEEFYL